MIKQNKCPNCNAIIYSFVKFNVENIIVTLDKKYQLQLYTLQCDCCKKYIKILKNNIDIAWNLQYQFNSYDKYVITKNKRIVQNKKYLYCYFPLLNQIKFKKLLKNINLKNIDAIVLPQSYKNNVDFNGEMCLLPDFLFFDNSNQFFPNYLIQKIIINEANKYNNSKLYSFYNTFLNKFNLLYNIKDWNKIKNNF